MRHALLATAALSLASRAAAAPPRSAQAKDAPAASRAAAGLSQVAAFADQQITGIAVSRSGRIFVNLPRWTLDVPVSVGEVKGGRITPYPDAAWNAYRNTKGAANAPAAQFVCVQSVVIDHEGFLWALDPASPGQQGPVKGGPKLVRIDLNTNKVVRVLHVDETAAPPGSYMNDVRFSLDDRYAYITDSGTKGAILVLDLRSGAAHRVLDGDPSTQFQQTVVVHTDGKPLRRPDGREPQFAADGIALSPNGATLYWQALTGKTLYSLPTAVLNDPARAAAARPTEVAMTHPADGLWIDTAGRFYISNPEQDSVEVADRPGTPLRTLVKDARLRWPDTFSQGPDGAMYITASHIQDSPWFKPQATTTPSAIFRIAPR